MNVDPSGAGIAELHVRIFSGIVERADAELVGAKSEVDLLRALSGDLHNTRRLGRQRNVEEKNAMLLVRAGGGFVDRELRDAGMLGLAAGAGRSFAEIVLELHGDAVPRVGGCRLRCVRLGGRIGG